MKQTIVSAVFVLGFGGLGFGMAGEAPVAPADRDTLHTAYLRCSEAARVRPLSRDEVDVCSAIYLGLKLSFLEGVTLDTYHGLDATSRARANREGYTAYRDWVGAAVGETL